jgi:hypothetical protein
MTNPAYKARAWRLAAAPLVCLCSLACSGKQEELNPVKGKVVFRDELLKGALVTFHRKGSTDLNAHAITGYTNELGEFTLKTGEKEGAPAGDYVITIICSEVKSLGTGLSLGGQDSVDRLKGVYAEVEKSTIFVTVKKGENVLPPFDLK